MKRSPCSLLFSFALQPPRRTAQRRQRRSLSRITKSLSAITESLSPNTKNQPPLAGFLSLWLRTRSPHRSFSSGSVLQHPLAHFT